jgi:hypothetical protein
MENSMIGATRISLDRDNSFYYSGETVSGTVHLNITGEKLKVHTIYIQFEGVISRETPVEDDKIPLPHSFYFARVVLAQRGNEENVLYYTEGQYSWPFQIPLQDHLPPILNPSKSFPNIRYSLRVGINKSFHKSILTETKYLMLFPRANLLRNPQWLLPTIIENRNRKEIILQCTLTKLGYVPGESIVFTLDIKNPRQVLIQRIDASLSNTCIIIQET